MVYREQLVIALVLKDLGITLPNAVLAQKVAAAQVVVDALTEREPPAALRFRDYIDPKS